MAKSSKPKTVKRSQSHAKSKTANSKKRSTTKTKSSTSQKTKSRKNVSRSDERKRGVAPTKTKRAVKSAASGNRKSKSQRSSQSGKTRAKSAKTNSAKTAAAKTKRTSSQKKSVGVSVKVRIDSKILERKVTLNRKETRVKTKDKIKLSPAQDRTKKLLSKFGPLAGKHFEKIGESINDLFHIRFRYEYKINGKKEVSYFSGKIAKIKNQKQLQSYMEMVLQSFQDGLASYLGRGFSDLTVSGVSIQGYQE